METKKKRLLFNFVMIVLISIIAFCGVMVVGNIKGYLGNDHESFAKVTEVTGIANIERKGIAYTLEKDLELKADDILETRSDANLSINAGENVYTLAEDSEILIQDVDKENFSMKLEKGEAFLNLNKDKELLAFNIGEYKIKADGSSVISVNVQTGSMGINVFEGNITIENEGELKTAKAGECISIINSEVSISVLQINSLNDFNVKNAKLANENKKLIFNNDELDQVTFNRKKEISIIANENKKVLTKEEQSNEFSNDEKNNNDSFVEENKAIYQREKDATQEKEQAEIKKKSDKTDESSKKVNTCTVQIRCDTILNNMDDLTPGKESFVPKDGVILPSITVEFTEGETAFDVLKRVCNVSNLQVEYSYTPMYGSYYIEGINQLYEFDCGSESGWMYKVNGWFPNYGCSSYTMKDGDIMVWCYTCKGLGADVGGSVY